MRGRGRQKIGSLSGDMKLRRPGGFSLMELIIFIVIAGIFVPLAYIAFSNAMKEATTPESIAKARFLAEWKMEELTKNSFADVTAQTTSYASVAGHAGYQWKWTVGYVTCGSATNASCAGETSPVIVDASVTTNYKKVVIYVKDPANTEYGISTIVTKKTKDAPEG